MGFGGSTRVAKSTIDTHVDCDARSKHHAAMTWALGLQPNWFQKNMYRFPAEFIQASSAPAQTKVEVVHENTRTKNFYELLMRFLLLFWLAANCMANSKFSGLLHMVLFIIGNMIVIPAASARGASGTGTVGILRYIESLASGNASYSSSTFYRGAQFAISEVRGFSVIEFRLNYCSSSIAKLNRIAF